MKYRELNYILLSGIFVFLSVAIHAQSQKKYVRQGNKDYKKSSFADAEVSYRKAVDKDKQSSDAIFNIGDALYKQNKFEEAGKQFIENINQSEDRNKKSAGLYNLGNSLLKANKFPESIEAYKSSLKLRPENNEAKYNLAYAQDMLVKQKEQEKEKQQQKENKDKDKDKEDQNKDQKDQKDNKNQQKDQNSNQNKDQKQKQQQQEQGISKEDAQRLLNALANDEKNVQEKVKLAKAAQAKVRTVKNW